MHMMHVSGITVIRYYHIPINTCLLYHKNQINGVLKYINILILWHLYQVTDDWYICTYDFTLYEKKAVHKNTLTNTKIKCQYLKIP
jgi:hypothetical protein